MGRHPVKQPVKRKPVTAWGQDNVVEQPWHGHEKSCAEDEHHHGDPDQHGTQGIEMAPKRHIPT
jgi:hypothetical protein